LTILQEKKKKKQIVYIVRGTMSYADKPPHVCEPIDQTQGRPATIIFLHGFGDEAEGLPLGM